MRYENARVKTVIHFFKLNLIVTDGRPVS